MLRVAARVDLLKVLPKSDHNGYRLCKVLDITCRACFFHLRILEKAGLIAGKLRYYITQKGKQMFLQGLMGWIDRKTRQITSRF